LVVVWGGGGTWFVECISWGFRKKEKKGAGMDLLEKRGGD